MLVVLCCAKLLIHLFTSIGYGYFRDEFYYLACADHLAWGYVDHPPLSIFVMWFWRALFGDSMFAIRFLPAVAGSIAVFLAIQIVHRLNGGPFAQLLAGTAMIVAPIYLAIDSFYSMNAFDLIFWSLAIYILLRILQGENDRNWIFLGLALGFGLLNKISVLWLGIGIFGALLLTLHRRVLLTKGPWIAALIAALLFSPYIFWQIRNGWPTLEFMHNATSYKMASISPLEFFAGQILALHPLTFPIWLIGLIDLIRKKDVRPLGLMYLIVFIILIINRASRVEYLSPAYPILFASGAVTLERWISIRNLQWLRPAYVALLIIGGAITTPLVLPLLPVEQYIRYSSALGMKPSTEERKEVGKLPQFFADRHGWDAMVADVAKVYQSLSPSDQAQCGIYAQNYGEAGAIALLGKKYHLPKALCGHNNYWFWGPGNFHGNVMIVIGGDPADHKQSFEEVKQAGVIECGYCMPYENHNPIFLCRGLKVDPKLVWPRVRHFD